MFCRILVRLQLGQLRRVIEEKTLQPTHWSRFLGSVTRCRPTRALRSVTGGSVPVGLAGWVGSGVRVWVQSKVGLKDPVHANGKRDLGLIKK